MAIYSLNVLEFPSTIDHICLILSTRYQHKFEDFHEHIGKKFNGISEYKDLRLRKPESPDVRKGLELEKEIEGIKKKVYPVVEKSVADLKKDKVIVSQGKKILPKADTLTIKTNGGFHEIVMPSIETIRKRKKVFKISIHI